MSNLKQRLERVVKRYDELGNILENPMKGHSIVLSKLDGIRIVGSNCLGCQKNLKELADNYFLPVCTNPSIDPIVTLDWSDDIATVLYDKPRYFNLVELIKLTVEWDREYENKRSWEVPLSPAILAKELRPGTVKEDYHFPEVIVRYSRQAYPGEDEHSEY